MVSGPVCLSALAASERRNRLTVTSCDRLCTCDPNHLGQPPENVLGLFVWLLQVNARQQPTSAANPTGNAFVCEEMDISTVHQAQRLAAPELNRVWRIKNPSRQHRHRSAHTCLCSVGTPGSSSGHSRQYVSSRASAWHSNKLPCRGRCQVGRLPMPESCVCLLPVCAAVARRSRTTCTQPRAPACWHSQTAL
jgi:hypothetical protein